jgi:lipid-binding SYLF domain-containing protein
MALVESQNMSKLANIPLGASVCMAALPFGRISLAGKSLMEDR